MSDSEPHSRGGLIGGTVPVQLVPDDLFDPLRWDRVAHFEPMIRGCCGEVVPAIEFYTGQHRREGRG